MIEEAYVSFETAKLLKDKGFDEVCWYFYSNVNTDPKRYGVVPYKNSEIGRDFSCCPTQQMAMCWLREVYGLFILIDNDDLNWSWQIFDVKNRTEDFDPKCMSESYGGLKSYEEAVENGIKYCLENLII